MARTSTESCVLKLKLKTSPQDAAYLDACFLDGWRIYNVLVRHCRKRLASLRQDPDYQNLLEAYRSSGNRVEKKELSRQLSRIVASYGLTEYGLHAFVKKQQARYKKHINSLVAQKIASSVWRGVEKVLYSDGKALHFRKLKDFRSLEGKNNATGLIFRKGTLYVNGRPIQVSRHKRDGSSARRYEEEALKGRVKYCRLVREPVGTAWHYYVQLILEGTPPRKHAMGTGRAGLDIGTSTAAVVSDRQCILTLLGESVAAVEKEQRRIARRMDRSRRATNPQNYRPDGTVKRGPKTWQYSKTYQKLQMRYGSLCRKRAAALKQEQEILANHIVSQCDTLYVEKMHFKGLQRRARQAKVKENGKYASRKRFGKSLQARAPAQFCGILKRKLEALGGQYLEVDTRTFRASQYDHVTDTYVKKKLSRRHHAINGRWIQRDLYSAFLLMNSADTLDHADRERCFETFDTFLRAHDACISIICNTKKKILRSFGLSTA